MTHSLTRKVLIPARWFLNLTSKARLWLTVKIKQFLKKKMKIIIGAGGISQSGWLSTDRPQIDLRNRQSWLKYFAPDTIDALLAEHVWEHLTAYEARLAIENCKEFLKQGGYIRVAVPDGLFPDKHYIEEVKPMGTGPGCHDHKALYTYSSLSALFTASGFTVKLLEYWDNDGIFHAEKWEAHDGLIRSSLNLDPRNLKGKIKYTSIIIDAVKS